MFKEKTILKLKKAFAMGYVPSRGTQPYYFVDSPSKDYSLTTNCFTHACFNLTNELIDRIGLNFDDSVTFSIGHILDQKDAEVKFTNFLKQVGLSVKQLSNTDLINDFPSLLRENEWVVALYFCDSEYFKDFHFFLQEKNESWSGKYGYKNIVEHFDELPACYTSPNIQQDKYYFVSKYIIENPFAKNTKEYNEHENS